MDRYEADWGMVERGWRAHVLGDAPHKFKCPKEALTELKKDGPPISTLHRLSSLAMMAKRSVRSKMTTPSSSATSAQIASSKFPRLSSMQTLTRSIACDFPRQSLWD